MVLPLLATSSITTITWLLKSGLSLRFTSFGWRLSREIDMSSVWIEEMVERIFWIFFAIIVPCSWIPASTILFSSILFSSISYAIRTNFLAATSLSRMYFLSGMCLYLETKLIS
jgi:hypothetical protein